MTVNNPPTVLNVEESAPAHFREQRRDRYEVELFTQLVINGVSVDSAKIRAKEAADIIYNKKDAQFPNINVG